MHNPLETFSDTKFDLWDIMEVQQDLEGLCSSQVVPSKPHCHLARQSTITRNTVPLSSAVASEILSISPLNKPGFFPRDFLTWDPDFMMGTSFDFLFCASRGSRKAHRFAASEAIYLFKKLVFWYTLNMNEMYADNNILRRFSDMFQGSLSLYPTKFLLGLLESSLSWTLLLLNNSVAFLNIVA